MALFPTYFSLLYSEIACIVFAMGIVRARPVTPRVFPVIISPVIRVVRYRSPAVKTVLLLRLVRRTVLTPSPSLRRDYIRAFFGFFFLNRSDFWFLLVVKVLCKLCASSVEVRWVGVSGCGVFCSRNRELRRYCYLFPCAILFMLCTKEIVVR